jgi:hypothetical protein
MQPSFQLPQASSSLPLPIPLQPVQRSLKSYSSTLHNEGLTVCLLGLRMRDALGVGVDIFCCLNDFGNEVGFKGLEMMSRVSDEAIDLANAPT